MSSFLIRGPGALRIHVRNQLTGLTLCSRAAPRVATLGAGISCGVCQVGLIRARGALQELADVLGQDMVLQLLEQAGIDVFQDPAENQVS